MRQSLASFVRAFVFAGEGIAHVFRTQRNMWVHLLISLAVVVLGWWLHVSSVEWAVLVLTMGVVFAAEMLNTVVESAVDLASPGQHPLAKVAKDAAAGAVLVLAICAVLVGALIFLPRLLALFAAPG
ncbi:MAG: diacylglycerol kinase family protein [Chloroflexi bacterium]|nr:diacylglycerol kinase family protein [Chloroflexota bacterium]